MHDIDGGGGVAVDARVILDRRATTSIGYRCVHAHADELPMMAGIGWVERRYMAKRSARYMQQWGPCVYEVEWQLGVRTGQAQR